MFELHPRLRQDTVEIHSLDLSLLLMMNDARFPWLILVPAKKGLKELHALTPNEQMRLMGEITLCSQLLEEIHAPDKINVGALGNLVPQLHIHVIARRHSDAAWPGPVWGFGEPEPYPKTEREQAIAAFQQAIEAANTAREQGAIIPPA
jgi:diadenosine tetraphosphate (Ap4A) HIT family hydrolase